ncbi:MAG: hypothetical protein WKF36_02995 [Candidatus Nitrosocosmicus sp.]
MPIKPSTLLYPKDVNKENTELINQFYAFMKNNKPVKIILPTTLESSQLLSSNLPKCLQI